MMINHTLMSPLVVTSHNQPHQFAYTFTIQSLIVKALLIEKIKI